MYVVKRKLRSALGDKVDSNDMANLLQHTQSNPVNPSTFKDELTLNKLTVKSRNKIPVGENKYSNVTQEGDIGAVVATTQVVTTMSSFPADILHVSGATYLIAYEGSGNDGYVATETITDAGAITAAVDTLEFAPNTSMDYLKLFHVTGDIYAVAYSDYGNTVGTIATFTVQADGTISNTVIDTGNFSAVRINTPLDVVHVSGNVYAIAYSLWSAQNPHDGTVATITIDKDGTVGTVIDTLKYEDGFCFYNQILRVGTSNFYAIAYFDTDGDGQIVTIEIDTDGTVANAVTDTLEFETDAVGSLDFTHIDGNYYGVAYGSTSSNYGAIATMTISSAGAISDAIISKNYFDFNDADAVHILHLSTNYYGIVYVGVNSDGWVSTMPISDVGIVGKRQDTYEFLPDSTISFPKMIHIDGIIYAILYGNGGNGHIKTIKIGSLAGAGYIWVEFNDGISFIGRDGAEGLAGDITKHAALTTGIHGVTGIVLGTEDVDDTPVNGATISPVSSNWAYDHDNDDDVHDATAVNVSRLSGATPDDVQDYINFSGDRTYLTGCDITAITPHDGTVAIAAGTAWCKESDSDTAVGKFFNFAGKTPQSLTDMTTNLIYIDYNGGTPQIVVATSPLTYGFLQDHILLGVVFQSGNDTHIFQADPMGIQGINRVHMEFVEDESHRTSGMVTTATGTRNLAVTAGVLHLGLNRKTSPPYTTPNAGTADQTEANKLHDADGGFVDTDLGKKVHNTTDDTYTEVTAYVDAGELTVHDDIFVDTENYDLDIFSYWYYDGDLGTPAWVEVPGSTAISNTQYNDVDTGLANLTGTRRGVHWVYMDFDAHLHVVYGQGNYTANQAEEAAVPASLPNIAVSFSVLIAKIIIQKDQSTMIITYPWTEAFTSSLATDHGSLGGLGGDDHTQYLLADGTRALAGAWDMGSQNLTNVNIDSGTIGPVTLTGAVTGGDNDLTQLGHLGLGGTAVNANYVITTTETITLAGGTGGRGFNLAPEFQTTDAEQTATSYGSVYQPRIGVGNTQNWTGSPSVVSLACNALLREPTAGSYTVAEWRNISTAGEVQTSVTLTALYHLYIRNAVVAGTLTNQYGIYIEDLTSGGTLDYGIYIAGADTYAIYVAADGIYAGGGIVLGDTVTLNDKNFDAGSTSLNVITTGAHGLKLTATNTGTTGVGIRTEHMSSSPAVGDNIFFIQGSGKDSVGANTSYCQYRMEIENPTNNSEAGKQAWWNRIGAAWNEAMTLSSVGVLWVDHSIMFDQSNDSAAVANQVSLGGYEISPGHRALAISSEEVVITESVTSDRTLPIRINGVTYKICLKA